MENEFCHHTYKSSLDNSRILTHFLHFNNADPEMTGTTSSGPGSRSSKKWATKLQKREHHRVRRICLWAVTADLCSSEDGMIEGRMSYMN